MTSWWCNTSICHVGALLHYFITPSYSSIGVEVWLIFMWINAATHLLLHPVSCLSARFGQGTELIYKMGQNYKQQQQFLTVLLILKRLQKPGDWTLISKVTLQVLTYGSFREHLSSLKTHIDWWWLGWGVRLCCNPAELTTWVVHWGCLYFTREFQAGQWTILDVKGSRVSYDSERREHITARFNVSASV